MVDWRSEEVEKFCDFMFKQMTVFVFGVYTCVYILPQISRAFPHEIGFKGGT